MRTGIPNELCLPSINAYNVGYLYVCKTRGKRNTVETRQHISILQAPCARSRVRLELPGNTLSRALTNRALLRERAQSSCLGATCGCTSMHGHGFDYSEERGPPLDDYM